MSSTDLEYFRERAAVERALAQAAVSTDVAAIHASLARGYEALVEKEEIRPRFHLLPEAQPRLSASTAIDRTQPPRQRLGDTVRQA